MFAIVAVISLIASFLTIFTGIAGVMAVRKSKKELVDGLSNMVAAINDLSSTFAELEAMVKSGHPLPEINLYSNAVRSIDKATNSIKGLINDIAKRPQPTPSGAGQSYFYNAKQINDMYEKIQNCKDFADVQRLQAILSEAKESNPPGLSTIPPK